MKQTYRKLFSVFVLASLLLSACGAAVSAASGGAKVNADIIITGAIESMDGAQWVVNGQTFTVDPSVVRDGPFKVGDTVKVEGNVQSDGTLVVTRVEMPGVDDLATATAVVDDNSNDANTNDGNVNEINSNDDNGNDDNSNAGNVNDDNGNDDNSNDDNSNDDNANDDSGNDDNSNDDNSNG